MSHPAAAEWLMMSQTMTERNDREDQTLSLSELMIELSVADGRIA